MEGPAQDDAPSTPDKTAAEKSAGRKAGFEQFLKNTVPPAPEVWPAAVAAFQDALRTEHALQSERAALQDCLNRESGLREAAEAKRLDLDVAAHVRVLAQAEVQRAAEAEAEAVQARERAVRAQREHLEFKPGFWEVLFSFGGRLRTWQQHDEPLALASADARVVEQAAREASAGAVSVLARAGVDLAFAQRAYVQAATALAQVVDRLNGARAQFIATTRRTALGASCRCIKPPPT